ncbi:hypothetical protein HUG10_21005 (plasmid) [Halorarum halophilum]|uniref:Uncharacterized protein n=1 Tax=Halorarum halophilum TaxID=2743090 RepID=A0A7D5GPR1_9EURY|nr:hypothetical protein [Halobaculum halophilum]QLG30067.1 hypothetical protein HUG10_21005 [Halobaculum halophilum]
MGDPFKDYHIREAEKRRRLVAEKYIPLVVWVKPSHHLVDDDNLELAITQELLERAATIPWVKFADKNAPRVRDVITEFDDE